MYAKRLQQVVGTTTKELVIIPLVVWVVVLLVLPVVISLPIAAMLNISPEQAISPASAAGMWGALIFGALLMIKVSKFTWDSLGFHKNNWVGMTALGLGLGFGAITLVTALSSLLGGTTLGFAFTPEALGPIGLAVVFFAAQPMWEELIYRGYLMPLFSKKWNDTVAIFATSALFVIGHLLNPGLGFLPILNLMVYGVVFAMLYYRSGSLWLVGATHTAWNFSQGFFYGSEVSGNPAEATVFRTTPVPGQELISGGTFGYEGSIITSVAGVIFILILAFWPKFTKKNA